MKQWRFIFTGANDAFFNMALDEAILQSCQGGDAIPTFRLYLWSPPGVSIGYFQSFEKTVDFNRCKERNIQVVRRLTGGRAVLHENEITYSICASVEKYPELGEDINQTYQKISFALLESLRSLEISAEWVKPDRERTLPTGFNFSKPCFISNSRYEITVEGKKLIGSAQRRGKNSFIQHGSIPLGKGKVSLSDLLCEENNGEKMRERLEDKSTDLEKILKREVEHQEVISALKKGFSNFFDVEMVEKQPTQKEIQTAQVLTQKKYSTEEWNFRKKYLPT
ncbi:MAG: biotin/lipoate A/B protein ligase family protein [Candidatus Zixiibacteriota bacterium]